MLKQYIKSDRVYQLIVHNKAGCFYVVLINERYNNDPDYAIYVIKYFKQVVWNKVVAKLKIVDVSRLCSKYDYGNIDINWRVLSVVHILLAKF